MQLDFNFRHIKRSQELEEYTRQRFLKLKKHEFRPISAKVSFFAERNECWVEIHVSGKRLSFIAKSKSENFYDSIDGVARKIMRQIARKKAKIQDHRCLPESRLGQIEKLNESLEYETEDSQKDSAEDSQKIS